VSQPVFPTNRRIAALFLALAIGALAGCRQPPPAPEGPGGDAEAGYAPPPTPVEAEPGPRGVTLTGEAPAGRPVRLATPEGQALVTRADSDGRWRIELPASAAPRIFGLSTEADGRRVQAEGYLLVGPRGQTALLRAGASALRLDHASGSRIAAVDFDGEGGAIVSGWAAAGTDVAIRLDGRAAGEARADDDGRFSLALPRLSPAGHRIEATGVAFTDAVSVDATAAAPLAGGPLRSQLTPQGLRADWLTPGGGVQSTVLAG
jgi:hypothetical protein